MIQEELNYIKDAFSQIIDDIAGNPDWCEAARAVASDLGTLERKLEEKVAYLPSNLDEAARKAALVPELVGVDEEHLDEYPYSPIAEQKFKEGAEWMAGRGYSKEVRVWVIGENETPAVFVTDVMYLPKNLFQRGDKVIVQIRKKQ